MATPLSDEIRALITYANETTEAGDTKLGDCVKTLCEGYNGGKNVPSSPLVLPQGAISSRLAALLAYANETTGKGDTTMGDAIRTLCEGYGGGELVFYEKLIGDGTAYINTKYIPTTNLTRLFVDFSADAAYAEVLGCRSGSTSNNSVNLSTGTQNKSPTYSIFYRNNVSYNLGATATNGWKVTIKATETGYNAETLYAGSTSPSVKSITKQTNVPNCPMTIFGSNVNNVHQTYTNTLVVKRVEIVDGSTSMHLVPCTYNGEAGMWDLVSQTFYGNAASSGQFTVEGEIGKALFYDTLKLPDLAASVDCSIDMGEILSEVFTDLYYSFKNNSGKNAGDFFGGDSANKRRVFISNYVVRFAFGATTANYVQSSLRNTNMKDASIHVYEDKIDMTILSTGDVTSYTSVQCVPIAGHIYLNKNFNTNAQASRIFHHLRIENEGNVLHDIVPAMSKEGLIGVYDKITDKFFYSELGQEYYILENTL